MKKIPVFLFAVQLIIINLKFLVIVCVANLLETIKKYKLLISLYLLIFSQVILLVFAPIFRPQEQTSVQLLSLELFQQEIGKVFDQDEVKFTKILLDEAVVFAELDKYKQPAMAALTTRDNLINEALLNLALNRYEKYQKKIAIAKNLDPNWDGWKKPSTYSE